jgi:hypothetical protein
MSGDTGRPRVEPERTLVTDAGVVPGRLGDDDGARLTQRVGRAGQMSRPVPARLLASDNHEHEAGRAAKLFRQPTRCGHEGGAAALHVVRAAPVEPIVGDLVSERIALPGVALSGTVSMWRQSRAATGWMSRRG